MLSLQECINSIKQEYPDCYPYAFVEFEGVYVFSIVDKGVNPDEAISDMHIVNPKDGFVSGSISIMEFLKNSKFRELWKKPNLVSNHDKSLTHSSFFQGSTVGQNRNWGIRFSSDSNYLEHHGIKNQRWGVRNGPPYPLDSKTHNRVTKGDDRSGGKSTKGQEIAGNPMAIYTLYNLASLSMLGITMYMRTDLYKTRSQNRNNKKNKDITRNILRDFANVDKNISSDNPPKKIEGKHSVEDDMSKTNILYDNGVHPYSRNNCVLCSITYDLRRRGYDVTSLLSNKGNLPNKVLPAIYDGAKEDKITAHTWNDYLGKLEKKYPDGSRGEIHVYGPYIGHSMGWEINNGKVQIIDSQRNVKMSAKDLNSFGFDPNHGYNGVYRLDNLSVNHDKINLASVELKNNWKETLDEKRRYEAMPIKDKAAKTLTDFQRRINYEKLWKKEHPNAENSVDSRRAMNKWVEQQISGV